MRGKRQFAVRIAHDALVFAGVDFGRFQALAHLGLAGINVGGGFLKDCSRLN